MNLTYEDLGRAASAIDAVAEEHGFAAGCEAAGFDPEVLQKFAEQRALRCALIVTEDDRLQEAVRGDKPRSITLSPEQRAIFNLIMPAYMDGVAAAARAKKVQAAEALRSMTWRERYDDPADYLDAEL